MRYLVAFLALCALSLAHADRIVIDGSGEITVNGKRYTLETDKQIVIETERPDEGGSEPAPRPDPEPDPEPQPDPDPQPDPEPNPAPRPSGCPSSFNMERSTSRGVCRTNGTDVFRLRTASDARHFGRFATSPVRGGGRRLWISESRGGDPVSSECSFDQTSTQTFSMYVGLPGGYEFACVLQPNRTYWVHVQADNPPHTYRIQYDHHTR